MKKKRIVGILSMALASIIAVTSVDITALAANNVEEITIEESVPEEAGLEEYITEEETVEEVVPQWIELQVDAPAANIESGSRISKEAVIRLSSRTLDAKIYYTTDGTDPVGEDGSILGKLYVDGIKARKVMMDSDNPEWNEKVVVIKAYAVKEEYVDSWVETFEYTIESESNDWGDITEEDRRLYATQTMPEGDVSLVPEGMWIAGLRQEGYAYNGNNITFDQGTENEIRVYEEKKLLVLNRDYTISYKNNKNAYLLKAEDDGFRAAKAPTVILKGKGNYSGSITKNFVINPMELSASKEDGTPVFEAPDITLAYNGKVQKGTTKVTYTNEEGKIITLKAKKDYVYSYPGTDETAQDYDPAAFKEAGETPYVVTIEGKGNYTGTLTFLETITGNIPISKVKVSAIEAQAYKAGEEVRPAVNLKYKGKTLTEYKEETGSGDYMLRYENNQKPGTAKIIVTGKNEYVGTRILTFKILGYDLNEAAMEGFQDLIVYTGDAVRQEKVKFSGSAGNEILELNEGEHYEVTYLNNEVVGTATVIYTGIEESGWTGTVKKKFKITPYDLNEDPENRVTVTDEEGLGFPQELSYVKGGVKPMPVVRYLSPEGREYLLEEGVDYKVSYLNHKALNDGSDETKMPGIKITGKGNFKGVRQKEHFTIIRSDIRNLTITPADKVYQKKKGKFTTSVVITDIDGKKLKAGVDYENNFKYYYHENVRLADGTEREAWEEVSKNDIVPAGTVLEVVVTGKGNYAGNEEEPVKALGLYRITRADIGKASVKVNKQYYTGNEVCPDKSQIIITLNGTQLRAQDYEIVSYGNNIKKGKAKLTVKGVGDYGGSKTVNFTIANKSMFYMISFNANGATSGSMKDLQIKYGQSYNLTKNAYKKRGYDFIGWNTESDGSGADENGNGILYEDMAKDPVVAGKEDMGKLLILYAQWEVATYKITYKLDGGVNHEQNPATYTINDEIVLKEPTKEGYTFAGWYTDSKFTESKKISVISKGSVGNKVLYAKWRVSFVDSVEKPEEGTYLNVLDYGATIDDNTDDTNSIERAVRAASNNYAQEKARLEEEYGDAAAEMEVNAMNTVYVPAGIYNITAGHAHNDGDPGISLKSNVNVIMDNNAVLRVAKSSYPDYCVISAKNVENIRIEGGRILGERHKHSGNYGEGGHAIAVYGGRNIEISNVSISSNWGDGIYLGTQAVRQQDGSQLYKGCNHITIKNCDIFDNRRSNISITDADYLTIEHCFIFDAYGTAPQCGIYIEPNSNSSGDKICRNLKVKDTTVNAYQGKDSPDYMCFMTHYDPYNDSYVTADEIWFINCIFNGFVGNYSGNNLHIDGQTKINGTFVNLRN